MAIQFNPCNPRCGCQLIGWINAAYGYALSCCPSGTYPYVDNVKDDISLLDDIDILFYVVAAGGCHPNYAFIDSSDWAAVRSWVEAGGRLLIGAEHFIAGGPEFGGCMTEASRTNLNDFLFSIGSSMAISAVSCNQGCVGFFSEPWYAPTVGSAQIVSGQSWVDIASVTEVTGGTALAETIAEGGGGACTSALTFLAIEAIGSGYVMVSGDGNIFSGACAAVGTNCWLIQRFVTGGSLI